jgi:hypothetical protein
LVEFYLINLSTWDCLLLNCSVIFFFKKFGSANLNLCFRGCFAEQGGIIRNSSGFVVVFVVGVGATFYFNKNILRTYWVGGKYCINLEQENSFRLGEVFVGREE